jgi:ABC-type multidrug transport system fused ATPase/permease subunit
MLHAVLRTPLRWIDTVPVGRVLNRFTADFNVIDSNLASSLTYTLTCGLTLVGITVATLFVSPIIIVFGIIFLLTAVYFARFYLAAAREARRLESTTKSPIFEQVCWLTSAWGRTC